MKELEDKKYYIQNKEAGFLGNSIIFWALNSSGYTANIENAHKYSYEEAKKICNGNPEKNKAWLVDDIDYNIGTHLTTDCQYLNNDSIVKF